ncbi:MAG TPA: 3'-5' exonuclease, partial [Gemmatimonadaceae bacterium]|nr:3'-5' exonuclease [Gemmatimonadaceae bacterium]
MALPSPGDRTSRDRTEDEWLHGWDATPGIVSVWADDDGRAFVWRRVDTGDLVREVERFRPWLLLDRLDDLRHLGARLVAETSTDARSHPMADARITYQELDGPGALRYRVAAASGRTLTSAVLSGASQRLGRRLGHLRDLEPGTFLSLPPDEQYLVATGRTYFGALAFDQLRRLQFDLETTGLDPRGDRVFMVAVRDPAGVVELLETRGDSDADEADLIQRLIAAIQRADPDVIENHNLHGFDLPFLQRRALHLGIPLTLGRTNEPRLRQRGARRGAPTG